MGRHGTGLCADVHATGLHPRAHSSRVRRQLFQYHFADDVVLRTHRGILRTLRQEIRNWNGGRHNVALHCGVSHCLVRIASWMDATRHTGRTRSWVIPLITNTRNSPWQIGPV